MATRQRKHHVSRWNQILTFGELPVTFNRRETWTDRVHDLYEQVGNLDWTNLPELLETDLEFIRDPRVFGAFAVLRLEQGVKAQSARDRIARIVSPQPHGNPTRLLPPADHLHAALIQRTAWLEQHSLLARFREIREAPARRLHLKEILSREANDSGLNESQRAALADAITNSYNSSLRSARSWTLNLLARQLDCKCKSIEQAIRDFQVNNRRRPAHDSPRAARETQARFRHDVEVTKAALRRREMKNRMARGGKVSTAEIGAMRDGITVDDWISRFRGRAARPSEYGPGLTPSEIESEVEKLLKPLTAKAAMSFEPEGPAGPVSTGVTRRASVRGKVRKIRKPGRHANPRQ